MNYDERKKKLGEEGAWVTVSLPLKGAKVFPEWVFLTQSGKEGIWMIPVGAQTLCEEMNPRREPSPKSDSVSDLAITQSLCEYFKAQNWKKTPRGDKKPLSRYDASPSRQQLVKRSLSEGKSVEDLKLIIEFRAHLARSKNATEGDKKFNTFDTYFRKGNIDRALTDALKWEEGGKTGSKPRITAGSSRTLNIQ